jgi:pimeloyl-ACP methyl ester carboxylesterase
MDAALFHEPRRRMIRIADGEVAALDFGDKSRPVDVLFAHANGMNAMAYRALLGPLSLSLRIVAVDLRGHGASRLPAEPKGRVSWHDFRDDLLELMSAVSDKPMILAGHSMGATSALLAAAKAGDRVKGLVLLDPVILPHWAVMLAKAPWLVGGYWRRMPLTQGALNRRSVFDSFGAAFNAYRGRGAFKTWPEIMLADYVAAGFHDRDDGKIELNCTTAWEAANFAAQANDPYAALNETTCPIHILRAEQNSPCHLRMGRLRRLPHVKLETVPGATHFLPMERPDIVRDALLDAAELESA